MDRILFAFSRWEDGELSGFDLGDITVTGPHGAHSSSGKTPDQSVMIFLSMAHLLSGMHDLAEGRRQAFVFVGVDSSYSFTLARKKNRLTISDGRRVLGEVSVAEASRALLDGVQTFLADPKSQLLPTDPAYEDLHRALGRLKQTVDRGG
jgi:hypothetical protein